MHNSHACTNVVHMKNNESREAGVPLTASEASDKMGVDRSTLTRWVAAGLISPLKKLPGVRGAMLFSPQDIQRLIDKRDNAA